MARDRGEGRVVDMGGEGCEAPRRRPLGEYDGRKGLRAGLLPVHLPQRTRDGV